MIDREHDLSITKQVEVLQISRGSRGAGCGEWPPCTEP
jgi:hypothetical protein